MNIKTIAEYLLIEVNQPELINSTFEEIVAYHHAIDYAGYIIIDNAKKTQIWSPHFYKALGFNANEIEPSNESLEKLLHPSDYVIIKQILHDFAENINKKLNIKIRYKTKSNTYLHLNSRIQLFHKEFINN
jgi:hypothetical protein